MVPILFRVGSYTVYSYSAALALGLLAGTWLAYYLGRRNLSTPSVVLDGGFWALLGGIVGARTGYVIANWAYWSDHLAQALDLRAGGLSWHGALLGGMAAAVVWYIVPRTSAANPDASRPRYEMPNWRKLLDVAAPGIALGAAFGWLGCLLTGACYGAEAVGYAPPLSWLAADLPDIFGIDRVRFLVQPLMIVWCLGLCGVLWLLHRQHTSNLTRLPAGTVFAIWLFLYAAGDLGTGFLRGDGTWRMGLWLGQWFAVAEMCAAAGLGLYAWLRDNSLGPAGPRSRRLRATAEFTGPVPDREDQVQGG